MKLFFKNKKAIVDPLPSRNLYHKQIKDGVSENSMKEFAFIVRVVL